MYFLTTVNKRNRKKKSTKIVKITGDSGILYLEALFRKAIHALIYVNFE